MTWSVLLMEVSVASLLLGWLWVMVGGGPWPAPWPILLSAPLALLAGRRIPPAWRRLNWYDAAWWASIALAVAALSELGSALAEGPPSATRWNLQFIAGLLLAWRGASLADGWIDRELIESEFQVGTVVVLAILLALVWIAPGAGLLPALVFAAAGLYGLGLARREERRDPRAGPETDWLALVGGLVVLVVLVAVAVVLLVTPEVLLAAWEHVQTVARASVAGVGALFAWLAGFFPTFGPPAGQPAGDSRGGGFGVVASPTPPSAGVPLPPTWLFELFMTFIGIVFLFFAIRAVVRLMKLSARPFHLRPPKLREPAPPISAPDAFSWGGWWRTVLTWLRAWIRGEARPADGGASRAQSEAAATQAEQRSVRALYRELLTAVARAGFERRPSTTPNELARDVTAARPMVRPSISAATELYERARYGAENVGRDDLARMRSAVQQARKDLAAPATERP